MTALEQGGRLPTLDYLIIGKPGIETLTFEDLNAHLARAAAQAARR